MKVVTRHLAIMIEKPEISTPHAGYAVSSERGRTAKLWRDAAEIKEWSRLP